MFVIADPETSLHVGNQEDGDAEMKEEEEMGWFYGDQDIRGILYDATRSMEVSIKKRKQVRLSKSFIFEMLEESMQNYFINKECLFLILIIYLNNISISIHLDLIRIATSRSQARGDIIMEQVRLFIGNLHER